MPRGGLYMDCIQVTRLTEIEATRVAIIAELDADRATNMAMLEKTHLAEIAARNATHVVDVATLDSTCVSEIGETHVSVIETCFDDECGFLQCGHRPLNSPILALMCVAAMAMLLTRSCCRRPTHA